jgi:CubicO group peptidase (beta-lactamase class C family)
MRRIVCGALALAACISAAAAGSPIPNATAPEDVGFDTSKLKLLDDAMDKAVDDGQVAGIEIMAVRHGRIADLHLHGLAGIAAKTPLERDSIFRMYSQTKPMIGVAMMILYEQGKWSLDDPITKFVPEFANLKVITPSGGLEDMKRAPTMRELVTHTAGFGYGLQTGNPVDDAFRAKKVLTSNGLKEMIDRVATIPLLYQPGTKWSYSIAVDIQGYIIEKISGETLGQYMREHVWGPLGMKDTGFTVAPENAARLSGVYVKNAMTGDKLFELTPAMPGIQDFTKPPPFESGGGGSVSTVDDYALYCQMMLNKGELGGVRILKPETVAMMETDQLEPAVVTPTGVGSEGVRFGIDVAISADPAKWGAKQGAGSFWWGGAAGTWFWVDPKNDLFFLGMIQRFGTGVAGDESIAPKSQNLLYDALTHPEK